ncbi:MAG TPA: glycoside hydrolase family 2 TIM barrel-domain containing protein [Aggregatilineales bacterium]|nr:glycoside hydrolase family 2 TIM barrel-domain containing protein [Aggregatilineales bacterium]
MDIPRPEYPRPQLVRDRWLCLNGSWQFAFDDDDRGLREKWFASGAFDREIRVPFTFQSPLSGIGSNDFHDIVWYQRTFDVPADWSGQRVLLHFGAVDYRAWVWVNGTFATFHEGGHTPFSVDITDLTAASGNTLTVRVEDVSGDVYQPRGKQYWQRDSASIFYTRTTGIWQTVWLEPVGATYAQALRITPDVDARTATFEVILGGALPEDVELDVSVTLNGAPVVSQSTRPEAFGPSVKQVITFGRDLALWSPEKPNLYDVAVTLTTGGAAVDRFDTYFGMRKISVDRSQVRLNNHPYTMRLVLDQGYHPEGILTFPTDEDFKRDIELTKALGFNGARKHQKVEDPRFLYWADKLGLLVWGEMANAYAYSEAYAQRITAEWQEAVKRDYSHPCIVAWVPLNESWGVPDLNGDARQIAHLNSLYYLTRALDLTRPIVSNDGWEHATTDLLTIHDYEASGAVLTERYSTLHSTLAARPANRDLTVRGADYDGQPILLTEFGGVAYKMSSQEGWGYSTAGDEADFLARLTEIMKAVYASPILDGFCYTQLTDVEQEINGLLTYDRQPKAPLDTIARIIRGEF